MCVCVCVCACVCACVCVCVCVHVCACVCVGDIRLALVPDSLTFHAISTHMTIDTFFRQGHQRLYAYLLHERRESLRRGYIV